MPLRFFRICTILLTIYTFQIKPFDSNTKAGIYLFTKQESENNLDTVKSSAFTISPPKAEKIERIFIEHGNKRIDKYFWLRDANNPKVIDYINTENAYTGEIMKHTIPLQEKLFSEMTSRIKQDEQTVPYFENGYFYYSRYENGSEYPVYCRKKGSVSA
jgi:oligopeptidase B